MVTITENYEIQFNEEFNTALNEFGVIIGDEIKHLEPLQKFYALRSICEEIESRASIYMVMSSQTMIDAMKEVSDKQTEE